jgi:hypothetical protein
MQSTAQHSPDSTLTPAQHRVLSLLAQGTSISAAAAAAGIHRNTVANWRRAIPAFAREFELAARERALFWHDQASALAQKAIDVLSSILNDETAAPSLRFRAALKVISMATEIKPYPAGTAEVEVPAPASENVEIVHNFAQNAQSCTNQPVRRAPEPGRNTQCPCGSGVKYKRCCANRASPAAA